jgi:hypothetical protein
LLKYFVVFIYFLILDFNLKNKIMEPNEIVRAYTSSDVYMTETARTIQSLFASDIAKFTNFDSTLTPAFANQFLAAVVAAETVVADSSVVDQQVQKTELVLAAMEKAKAKYADVKYFAIKAFPNSPGTQNEFGLNDYENARKSTPQMVQFLDEMSKACVKYQPQLLTAGYNAPAIVEIQTIRTELLTANSTQEVFKKQRPKLTEDRIIILNTCYNFVTQVNQAAQLVFKTDFAKQKQYVFNPSTETSNLIFAGTVKVGETKLLAVVPFLPENVFAFKNTGIVPLIFCLSTTTDIEGIKIEIGGGAVITKSGSELNLDATNLLVLNTDSANEGSYEVEVAN